MARLGAADPAALGRRGPVAGGRRRGGGSVDRGRAPGESPATNPPYVEVSWQRDGATTARHVAIPQPVQPVIVATETGARGSRRRWARPSSSARRQRLATGRAYGLRGRIVAMDDAGTVIPDGVIYVENETIFAVQAAEAEVPSSFQDVEVVDVQGTIYPGLDRAPQPPRVRCTTALEGRSALHEPRPVGRRLRLPRVRNGASCRPSQESGPLGSRRPLRRGSLPGSRCHHITGQQGERLTSPDPAGRAAHRGGLQGQGAPVGEGPKSRRVGPRTSARRLKVARPCSCTLPKVRTIGRTRSSMHCGSEAARRRSTLRSPRSTRQPSVPKSSRSSRSTTGPSSGRRSTT